MQNIYYFSDLQNIELDISPRKEQLQSRQARTIND